MTAARRTPVKLRGLTLAYFCHPEPPSTRHAASSRTSSSARTKGGALGRPTTRCHHWVGNRPCMSIDIRAFLGKVDAGFPKGNATSIESRALSDQGACDFMVNLIG